LHHTRPTPDLLGGLYDLSASVSGTANVEVHDATSGALIDSINQPVTISTQNDVFWSLGGALWASTDSVTTLVRPDAPPVLDLFDDVVQLSWFGGTIGTGGYRAHTGSPQWPLASQSVSAGNYVSWCFYLEAGESTTVQASSNGGDSVGYLFDQANYDLWVGGSSAPVFWNQPLTSSLSSGSVTAASAGNYCLVLYNGSSIFSETITYRRAMTYTDNVLDYLQMIYNYLQDLGINYISVSSNFFSSSQAVLLPDDVLSIGGANCIDGTVLFASILEQMGVRPIIFVVEGHAFIGIDSGPTGYNTTWALETTMLGSGAGYYDAVLQGLTTWGQHTSNGTVIDLVYVDEARADGLLPMP